MSGSRPFREPADDDGTAPLEGDGISGENSGSDVTGDENAGDAARLDDAVTAEHAVADVYPLATPTRRQDQAVLAAEWEFRLLSTGTGGEATDGGRTDARQVSLFGVLAIVTLTGVLMGLRSWLPSAYVAGICGAGALVGLMALELSPRAPAIVFLAWWSVVLVYGLMSMATLFRL